ncbi:aryl-alcohol dehydrogenase-like predicted oxidoreductase [Catenulispora sp. MAP5-51]
MVGTDLTNGFAVPATHHRRWDFNTDVVRRSLEDSLDRLGLDRVDIVYLHGSEDHAEAVLREAYPALEAEANGCLAGLVDLRDEPGYRLTVRNGHHAERTIAISAGPVWSTRRAANDRRRSELADSHG